MRKALSLVLALCFILIAAMPTASAEPTSLPVYVDGCEEYVSLRSAASTSASVEIKVPYGETVARYNDDGKWSYCSYQGYFGYILSKYLFSYDGYWYANYNEYISLRAYASTSADRIAKIPSGDVFVIESIDGEWAYGSWNGNYGYVLFSYLEWMDEYAEYTETWYVHCNEYVSLRELPNTSSTRLKKIPDNTAVQVIDMQEKWSFVLYDNEYGYVLSEYLYIDSSESEPGAPLMWETRYVDANEYVTLRASKSTSSSALRHISAGSAVTVYSDDGKWSECQYGSEYGYILSSYLVKEYSKQYTVKCNEFVSLRETRSTGSLRLAQVPVGAKVNVYEIDGQWAYCSYLGQKGYILAAYLVH